MRIDCTMINFGDIAKKSYMYIRAHVREKEIQSCIFQYPVTPKVCARSCAMKNPKFFIKIFVRALVSNADSCVIEVVAKLEWLNSWGSFVYEVIGL